MHAGMAQYITMHAGMAQYSTQEWLNTLPCWNGSYSSMQEWLIIACRSGVMYICMMYYIGIVCMMYYVGIVCMMYYVGIMYCVSMYE